MTALDKLLIESKIEETVSRLRADGYKVTPHPNEEQFFDIVAEKNGHKIAYEVKPLGHLRKSAAEIRAMKQRIEEQGYDDVRLLVARPPRRTNVTVEKLDKELFRYFEKHVPEEIKKLSSQSDVNDVSDLEIDAVQARPQSLRVSGIGVVDTQIPPEDGGMGVEWDFPFTFDVELNSDLSIQNIHEIKVDTDDYEP